MKGVYFPLVGLMLCQAAPLLAQKKPSLEGERIVADFAQCVVRAAPRQARMVMDSVPDSEDERSQLDLLLKGHSKCLNFGPSIQDQQLAAEVRLERISLSQALSQLSGEQRQMAFSHRALRGAIAERLYLDLPKAKSPAPPPSGPVDDRDVRLPVGYVVVRCAAGEDPVSADRLVRSKRLSSDETDAGRVFAPALNSCVRGKGKVDISGTMIHGWVAEALYKQRRFDALEGR